MYAMARRPIMENRPLKPRLAMRAMQDIFAEPEETSHVFRVIRALSNSRRFEKLFERVMSTEEGRRTLEERESLLPVLSDRDRLRAMP
jgi:ubiquinone biosynthesis protein Coq4